MRVRPASARVVIAALAVSTALLTGCGNGEGDETPAACIAATSQDFVHALERAPGQVRLDNSTPISACLVPGQSGGQLASIGREMVVAATKLNAEARAARGGPAAVQLGYLLGAVGKGADAIHTDLVRRLNSSAHFSASGGALPASFERAFARGYAAGQASG